MGTCMSKKAKQSKKSKQPSPKQPSGRKPAHEPEAASRNPPEEEKVKEVLSETPRPSLPTKPVESVAPVKPEVLAPETLEPPVPEKNPVPKKPEEASIDVSETTVSMSESASMAVTEDSNATEVQQPLRRTPVYRKREDLCGRRSASPARRSEASPGRRTENASSRVPGKTVSADREAGSPAAAERRHRVKRVSGELGMRNNARRSRSPVARAQPISRPTVNRSNSKRAPLAAAQNAATGTEEARRAEGDGSRKGEQQQQRNGSGPALTDESIDNPLVSLECFIFL